jgi:hypothetical protein
LADTGKPERLAMPFYGKQLPLARRLAAPEQGFSLGLAGLALFLSVFVCALLINRAGVLDGLQRAGDVIENGLRLIGSVDVPFG